MLFYYKNYLNFNIILLLKNNKFVIVVLLRTLYKILNKYNYSRNLKYIVNKDFEEILKGTDEMEAITCGNRSELELRYTAKKKKTNLRDFLPSTGIDTTLILLSYCVFVLHQGSYGVL